MARGTGCPFTKTVIGSISLSACRPVRSFATVAHEVISTPRLQAALERLRPVIDALPGAFEKLSHGSPAFFVGEGRKARTFASLHDERQWGKGRLCLWLAAPEGMQEGVVAGDPVRWFVPPYVGHRGWIGLRLDLPDTEWDDAAGALEDAHAFMADGVR